MSEPKCLSWQEGLELVLSSAPRLQAVEVELERACGLVSAAETHSPVDVPPFANSAMDGYAVSAADTAGAAPASPVELRVVGLARAGMPFGGQVGQGQAVEIMTGAPLPQGADAVVRLEDTQPQQAQSVRILAQVRPGTHVRQAGKDSRKGQLLLAPKTLLAPAHIGLLASCGIGRLAVYAKPSIALLSSGDELVDPSHGDLPAPGQIFDANAPMLSALLRSWGYPATFSGRLPDSPDAAEAQLEQALGRQVVITTGGVSVGRYDFLRASLKRLGCEEVFWRINQQPGGPLLFARRGETVVFGLPGNPVSCFVCAELYVRPYLSKASGQARTSPAVLPLVLDETLTKSHAKTAFLRGRLILRGGKILARPAGAQDSNLISSLVERDGYIVFPAKKTSLKAGETVDFLLMNEESFARLSAQFLDEAIRKSAN